MSNIPVKPDPTQKTDSSKPVAEDKQPKKGNMLVVLLILVVIAVVAGLWAANNNKKESTPSTKQAAVLAPAAVTISANGFSPANIKVTAGTAITWTNMDKQPHRVASDPYPTNNGLPGFDSHIALNKNDTYSYTFTKAGTFTYHDQMHPNNIKGSVIVVPANE